MLKSVMCSALFVLTLWAGLWHSSSAAEAPVPDPANGKKLYTQHCALCHGKTGQGDGMAGKSLKPPPRDFTQGKFKFSKDDAGLLAFIKKGKGAMPAWGKTLSVDILPSLKEGDSQATLTPMGYVSGAVF
ncbi:MAG: cytochrome c, partial [Candidatus Sericytochromatia bacterium]|nr:cytochrome c [Candidatus Sericytochromatia bacterium]